MHFERRFRLSKCIELYLFPEKNDKNNIYVPTLPKILRPVNPKHLFFIWPNEMQYKTFFSEMATSQFFSQNLENWNNRLHLLYLRCGPRIKYDTIILVFFQGEKKNIASNCP